MSYLESWEKAFSYDYDIRLVNEKQSLEQDAGLGFRYVVANEADLYVASDNETEYGYVTVVDAVQQKVTF